MPYKPKPVPSPEYPKLAQRPTRHVETRAATHFKASSLPTYTLANSAPNAQEKGSALEQEAIPLIKRLEASPTVTSHTNVAANAGASPSLMPLSEVESMRLASLCHRLLEHHPYNAKRIGAVAVLWTGYQVTLKDTEAAAFATLSKLRGRSADVECFKPEWRAVQQRMNEVVQKAYAKFHSLLENLRKFAHTNDGRRLIMRCYLCLGDICRYRDRVAATAYARAHDLSATESDAVASLELPPRHDWRSLGLLEESRQFYESARCMVPQHGQPYNQLAIIHDAANHDALQAAYFYVRAATAPEKPFKGAPESLRRLMLRLTDANGTAYPHRAVTTYDAVERHCVALWATGAIPDSEEEAAFADALAAHAASGQVAPQERLFTKMAIATVLTSDAATASMVRIWMDVIALLTSRGSGALANAIQNTDFSAGVTFLLLNTLSTVCGLDAARTDALLALQSAATSLLRDCERRIAAVDALSAAQASHVNDLVYFRVVGRIDSGGRQLGLPPEDVELDGTRPDVMQVAQRRLMAALSSSPCNAQPDTPSSDRAAEEVEVRRRKTPMVIDGLQLEQHRLRRLLSTVHAFLHDVWSRMDQPAATRAALPSSSCEQQPISSVEIVDTGCKPAAGDDAADDDEGDEVTPQQALARLLWGVE